MDQKIYVTVDGTIIMEDELTPELRKELGIDENGNRIEDEDDDYDYREDYESEEDLARGEGFWIDDDGHWVPIEDDDWY